MIILRQKEFNSKAAKALNNKYLKEVAAKSGIPVYEAKGFKTVEIDPNEWKSMARIKNRDIQVYKKASYPNKAINFRQMDRDKELKKIEPIEYDHGNRIEEKMTSKLKRWDRDYLKEQLLKSKEARKAAKKA